MENQLQTPTFHPIDPSDAGAMVQLRAMAEPSKGLMRGIEARPIFNEIVSHTPAPSNISFEPGELGGVSGYWARPENPTPDAAILYFHGGWYMWGSALAQRNLAGHLARRANVAAFVAEYRLAPENPFPAATDDAQSAYQGLLDAGFEKIALAGESAGGNLSLVLASILASKGQAPSAIAPISPVTDFTFTGESWTTRADADPYFVKAQAEELAPAYIDDADPKDPLISPLFGELQGLPPIAIHVGDAELLLDDSVRYFQKAAEAGVDVHLDIWEGLPHVFQSSVGSLVAADRSLDLIASFLAAHLGVKA